MSLTRAGRYGPGTKIGERLALPEAGSSIAPSKTQRPSAAADPLGSFD